MHIRLLPRQRNAVIFIVFAIIMVLSILTILDAYYLEWRLTGFGSKPLWDWLDLLIVPVILAFGAYWFSRSEKNESALQRYLDQMSELLLDQDNKLYNPGEDKGAKAVAQARTSTILRRLDGDRKAVVLLFLYETDLITKDRQILNLRFAELRGAMLNHATLADAHLEGADLREVEMRQADLHGAKLAQALLIAADLRGADLRHADLSGADLSDANLIGAQLSGADLTAAVLRSVRFHDANLSGATLKLAELNNADFRKVESLHGTDFRACKIAKARFTKQQLEDINASIS